MPSNTKIQCECGKTFSTSRGFKRHQRNACDLTSNNYNRNDSKTIKIKSKYDLRKRKENISTIVVVPCDCGNSFSKTILGYHQRTCPFVSKEHECDCGKRFLRKNGLDKHKRTCIAANIKYQCECGINFTAVNDLHHHQETSCLEKKTLHDLMEEWLKV